MVQHRDHVIILLPFLPANTLAFLWKSWVLQRLEFVFKKNHLTIVILAGDCYYYYYCCCYSSWIMIFMGSSDEGCGGRWLKALAGGSHRFLLDGDSFQALYGRFFSGLICSLSYFSHFLCLIYHCFEFFFWECSLHPAMNKCKWFFMVCGKWLSIFFNSLQWWEYFWSVQMFFQSVFSGCINHSIGH